MIEARKLGHQFSDGVWGLEAVDLQIPQGQWLVVAGTNGAGKTLLMRHLVGLVKPTTGQVLFDGTPIHRALARVRQSVGLVFQDSSAQIVGLTVEEEVSFGPRNLGWSFNEIRSAVDEALRVVHLESRRLEVCARLSGGERRRLAIGGVLATRPRVILLDEPFTGLDYPSVRSVLQTLRVLHSQGISVVILTHELDKCLAHAQRLVLMASGRIVANGTPQEIWERIPEVDAHRPHGGVERLAEMTWLD